MKATHTRISVPFRIALLAATCCLPPSAPAAEGGGGEILGKVGEAEVRVAELRKSLLAMGERELEAMRADPAVLNQVVRSLLIQQLVVREAAAKGWDKGPEVQERLERLRDGVVATSYLESRSEPAASYPNEAELLAAYEAGKDSLLLPKSWRLAQIFIADPKGGEDAAASARATAKLAKIKAALAADPKRFEELARSESEEADSAARGGEIGWLAENQIVPGIREVLPPLALGGLSEAVRLDDGWHLIKVLDIREAHTPTLDQIRPQLVRQMRLERARANNQALLARLIQEHPIALNEMMLSKLLPAAGGE
jgi:parvulin-like peptidyl-prolyl isomerase